MVRVVMGAILATLTAFAPARAQLISAPRALSGQTLALSAVLQPETQFYFNDSGRASGPASLAEIRAKVAAGAIKPDTLVWKTGLPNWLPAKDLPEVASLLQQTFDASAYFAGTWELQAPGPRVSARPGKVTIVAAPGGTLTGKYNFVIAAYNATASIPIAGTWKSGVSGDRRFTLTLNLKLQIEGETKLLSTVSRVEIVDDNTLRDEADGTISKRVAR
jgi:hypothetical protein